MKNTLKWLPAGARKYPFQSVYKNFTSDHCFLNSILMRKELNLFLGVKKLFSLQLVLNSPPVMEDKTDQYSPGTCNIGVHEIKVRKKFIGLFLPLTLIFTFLCLFYCHSLFLWSLLVFSSFALIVLYLEIKYRFCILFGFFSLYNFNRLGNLHEVKNKDSIRKDQRRVWEIVLIASAFSLFFATGIHLLGECLF